jgi:hypothetical protein
MPTGTQIIQQNPPLYDFTQLLSDYLIQMLETGQLGAPGNPYDLNVPLSPSAQAWGRQAQNFSISPAPAVLGQAAGTIGRFMNPDYSGIIETLKGGYPMEGREFGGPVEPGGTYTVGESGPETLYMGQSGGYVAPGGYSREPAAGGPGTQPGGAYYEPGDTWRMPLMPHGPEHFWGPDWRYKLGLDPNIRNWGGGSSMLTTEQGHSISDPPYGGGREFGGPVDGGAVGQSFTVGENGPETLLLDAGSRGSILPNTRSSELSRMLRSIFGNSGGGVQQQGVY